MIESYPLYWPEHRKRTERYYRERSKFEASVARSRDEVVRQVQLLVGRYTNSDLIISTNLALRRDGLPLANQKQPDDPGVAIYFTYRKKQVCFACDRWQKVEDNMHAIALTIDALRGINRWGTGDMVEAAFRGFEALPSPEQASTQPWRTVLGLPPGPVSRGAIDDAYRVARSRAHPDRGGTSAQFQAVQAAYEQACREVQA